MYDVFFLFSVLSFFQTPFAAQLHCIHRRRRRRSATCKEYMPNRRRYKDIKDIHLSFGAKVWPVMKSNLSLMSGCRARPAGFIQFLGMHPHSSIIWMLLLDGFKCSFPSSLSIDANLRTATAPTDADAMWKSTNVRVVSQHETQEVRVGSKVYYSLPKTCKSLTACSPCGLLLPSCSNKLRCGSSLLPTHIELDTKASS